jgi:hypothetical protein
MMRRERDSNPRYRFQYDSLANCSFRPLRHLSVCSGGRYIPVFGIANIAIQCSRQKINLVILIIYSHMVNTHQHFFEDHFYSFNIFQGYVAVIQLPLF